MRKRRFPRRKYLIIFNSYLYTIKSIYRKKVKEGKHVVYLHFNETSESYAINVEDIANMKEFKKGDLVTLHAGNGGYVCLEKGNTLPEDGKIKVAEITC